MGFYYFNFEETHTYRFLLKMVELCSAAEEKKLSQFFSPSRL